MLKKKLLFTMILSGCLLVVTGCADTEPKSVTTDEALASVSGEAADFSGEIPESSEGQAGNIEGGTPSDLLTRIRIEAGTEEISPELLFSPYSSQTVTFLKELTPEELSVAGEVYNMAICYREQEFSVLVEIVDTTPPTINGAQDLEVIQGESLSYKKNVEITDNSSQEVSLTIDNSRVDLNTPGSYPASYIATDVSGNVATAEITVTVNTPPAPTEEGVTQLADAIIAEILTDDMSQYDQAYALWNWCRKNITYSYSSGDTSSIWTCAYEGLYGKEGNCYAYYAAYAVLLDRCGIQNMCVTRSGGASDHVWNLVNVGDGWYHCDTSPRHKRYPYECFMQTDAQIQAYTETYLEKPNYYTFDPSLYPERATKIIYGN